MKKINCYILMSALACASCLAAPAGSSAAVDLPKANVFSTSFEQSDTPAYAPEALRDQNRWVLNSAPKKEGAMIVTGGTDSAPPAPGGTQMLRLKSTRTIFDTEKNGPYASIKFTNEPLTGALSFSGVTAFVGEVSPKTGIISRFYLSSTAKRQAFLGMAFGIWQKDGELRFFYTKAPRGGTINLGRAVAQEGTFYRFEVDADIAAKTYRIRVYDNATGKLLASAGDGMFRGDVAIGIDYLRLNNASDTPDNGDNFVTYYDDLWLSTDPAAKP